MATAGTRVGLVFQDPSRQLVMDRVGDDVAFGLENLGWPREAMLARVPVALDAVGLGGMAERIALELSGGQRQRLALAGVLAPEPPILVLDEPTANLDPAAARAFLAGLDRLRAEGRTLVLVEHRVDAAWPLADLVLALGEDGAPLAVGTPDAVLAERPRLHAAGIWLPGDDPAPPPRSRRGPTTAAGDRLVAEDVTFAYEPARPVLRGVDLRVGAGERLALVGPNGSGKSTLGRLLVGLLRPDAGGIRLDGRDPAGMSAADVARAAGYVFQEPERQFLTQRVRDEVLLGLRPAEGARADAVMDRLGLPLATFGERSPYRLSGGEQRRLSLATALVREPSVLVLDEPTFGQDRHGYDGLLELLADGVPPMTTVIAATHDERFVADATDRVVRLEDGVIVADEIVR
jgi:energy-coupling factor transporter ATP-binding protein EcfA2